MPSDSLVFKCNINGSLLKLGSNDLGLDCSVKDTGGVDIGTFGVRLGSENGKRNIEFSVSKDLVSGLISTIDVGKLLEKVDLGKLIGTDGLF
jgi:hypothetical protein